MIARLGEPKQDTLKSGTYDSITINTYMYAAAANNALVAADFKPEQVQVKVVLRRNGSTKIIMSDNLLVLGTFNSLKNGLHWFVNGFDRVYAASGVKAIKNRVVKLKFGGCYRIDKGDELIVEVSPSENCFTSNIDTATSYIDFYANPAIGYELGYFSTKSEVVQQSSTNQPFSLGHNVTRIGFLNFDKTSLSDNVITNLTLSSDRLDTQMSFNKILGHIASCYPDAPPYRFGATPPTQSVFRFSDQFPQSFILFDGETENNELDDTRLELSFDGAQVAVSKNYVVWQQYEATKEQIEAAMKRQNKHLAEGVSKLKA